MTNLKLAVAIAKAKTKVKRRKKKEEEEREQLLSSLEKRFKQPVDGSNGVNGRDGRDAPTMEEILLKVTPMLPEPRIEVTEKTVVQEINPATMEDFIKGMLPKEDPTLRPPVEQITVDVSDEKLEGFVTKKEMDEHLKRIQRAISSHSGGGNAVLNDAVKTNEERLDELVSELTDLLTEIASNTNGLDQLELLFSNTIDAIKENKTELQLLNARTEEAFDTTITHEDLENG